MYVRFGKKSLSPVASAAAVLIENRETAKDKTGVQGDVLTTQPQ